MKLRRTRIISGLVALGLVVSIPLATTALAEGTVAASITGDPVAPGQQARLTLEITPETTLGSFTLTPPTNWQLVSDGDSPSPGSATVEGEPSYTIDVDGNTLLGSDLGATSEDPAIVQFDAETGCKGGDQDWTLDAFDSEGNPLGSEGSDLSTNVESNCTALATITGDPVAPGQEATLGFTIVPSGGTLDSFSLTPPANWQLVSGGIATSPSPSPGASNFAIQDNKLVGSDLGATSNSSASVHFRVKTGCKDGDWTWTFAAVDKNGDAYDNGPSSDLTTNVSANCTLVITTQPKDTGKNTLITGTAFDNSSNFVTVALRNGLPTPQTVTYFPVDVTFDLAAGPGLVSTGLSAATKTTVNGVATFSGPPGTLSISSANEPFVTAYRLKPKTVGALYAGLTGDNSGPFDVWDAGCKGNGCGVNLAPGTSSDAYATSENVGMGASLLGAGGTGDTNIFCPTQQLIFSTNVFFHATTGTGPVFLVTHISAADRKKVANNGNKVMGWCVGLKSKGPWNFVRQNTNGDAVTDPNNGTWTPGSDLWVGMAPKCPSKNPSTKAPCIVSQVGDGVGGTYIRGWLPGGDPPRRT